MYDAIVIGARCGGSPTAMLLARKGYRVLLVDKGTFPSDIMSTHYIHQAGVACLKRWDLLDKVADSIATETNYVVFYPLNTESDEEYERRVARWQAGEKVGGMEHVNTGEGTRLIIVKYVAAPQRDE